MEFIIPFTDVKYWECNKRFKGKGVIGCRGENVQHITIEKGFVKAWNEVVKTRSRRMKEWKSPGPDPLTTYRKKQMIELTEQGAINEVIP